MLSVLHQLRPLPLERHVSRGRLDLGDGIAVLQNQESN